MDGRRVRRVRFRAEGRVALAASVLVLVASGQDAGKANRPAERVGPPKTFSLKRVEFKPGELRMTADYGGEAPTAGFAFDVRPATFVLFDLDGDGAVDGDRDGIGMIGAAFVARRGERLWCSLGDCDVKAEGTSKVTLTPRPTGVSASLVSAASVLTELRLRFGSPPLVLDAEASRICESHCDYLKLNPPARAEHRSPFMQFPGSPGYTPEGKEAAVASAIIEKPGSVRDAIVPVFATPWRGFALVDPAVRKVGAALKNDYLMIYPVSSGWPSYLVRHPADGARNVPTAFSQNGERPNPAPETRDGRGLGFPIMARLEYADRDRSLESFTLTDAAGKSIKGLVSSPKNPAHKEWKRNSELALFLPEKPLQPKTTYTATIVWVGRKPETWSFTTGAGP